MKKLGPKSYKLGEISKFINLLQLIFHLSLTQYNTYNLLHIEIEGSYFGCFLIFLFATNCIL